MQKILVIEDEDAVRENVLELLDAEGYLALGAVNGAEGIQAARENLPDLILCDILMPKLDGYAVWTELSKEAITATIPFIFLTAKTDRSDLRRGMEMGVDDYIAKPFTREELLRAIDVRLVKRSVITGQAHKKLNDLRASITRSLPHEMLTPLSVIMGYAELLASENMPLSRVEVLSMGRDLQISAQRLLETIQNYLLFSELEILGASPERAALLREGRLDSIQPAITEIARMKAEDEERLDTIRIQVEDSRVCMAEMYLQKIVEELLDNALKYSGRESLMEVTGQVDRQSGMYCLAVQDQGRGMSPGQIANVGGLMQFDRKRYEQQGTGLGLAICRRLAELHGGRLEIKSTIGKGTHVRVWIPIEEDGVNNV